MIREDLGKVDVLIGSLPLLSSKLDILVGNLTSSAKADASYFVVLGRLHDSAIHVLLGTSALRLGISNCKVLSATINIVADGKNSISYKLPTVEHYLSGVVHVLVVNLSPISKSKALKHQEQLR
jgi:hypothetical protein